jgi:phosphoribosylanthranilate isomerase
VNQRQHRFPRIKICGLTREVDIHTVHGCGVDAVGLNLVPSSPRYIGLARAIELARLARTLALTTVAVVMNPAEADLRTICSAFEWDFLQLHGSESVDVAACCKGIPLIKASSWSGRVQEHQLVEQWSSHFFTDMDPSTDTGDLESTVTSPVESVLAGFLIDAFSPGQGGGSGRQARWDLLAPRPSELEGWPLLLAGGITPDNVAQAVRTTNCDGVDTASGVEAAPGIKDPDLVRLFAYQARAALDAR